MIDPSNQWSSMILPLPFTNDFVWIYDGLSAELHILVSFNKTDAETSTSIDTVPCGRWLQRSVKTTHPVEGVPSSKSRNR